MLESEVAYRRIFDKANINNEILTNHILTEVSDFRIEPIEHKKAIDLLKKFHYLPEHKIVGRRILYQFIDTKTNFILAIMIWGNTIAPNCEARDTYLQITKHERLHNLANNLRFLILPDVKVKNLASRIISKSIKQLKIDWQKKYGDKLQYVETFVDSSKGFKGTCYLTSSWKMVGYTKGFSFYGRKKVGKLAGFVTTKCNTPKMIFVKEVV